MCVSVFRYIFLFDKVVIVCKRKGYSYELKEIIELQSYKMSDDPMNNRDMKKVRIFYFARSFLRMQVRELALPHISEIFVKAALPSAGDETSCVIITNVALELKDLVDGNFRYGIYE